MSLEYGMMLGAADALRNTNRAWERSLNAAQGIINEQYDEIQILKANERKLKTDLALEKARSAGLSAKMRVIQSALREMFGAHPCLRRTGRHFPGGAPQIVADEAYATAFDATTREHGLSGVLRIVAV